MSGASLFAEVEQEVDGVKYKIGRLPPLQQAHVLRRVIPVLVAAGIPLTQLMSTVGAKLDDTNMLKVFEAGMDVIARMSNEDFDYIVLTTMAVVKRQQGPSLWAPMSNGRSLAFQDLSVQQLVQLTILALKENMGSFFSPPPAEALTPQGS